MRGEIETRQEQAVTAGLETHARVDVAGPDKLHAGVIHQHFGGVERVVDEGDLAVDEEPTVEAKLPRGGDGLDAKVVVAGDEFEHGTAARAPGGDEVD
ncbi:MAG: hypothetical protein AMXMBFR58_22640 [Phycisphaerae bacterium]